MERKAIFMPAELHKKIKARAMKNHRTLVGELQALLESSK